MRLVDLGSSPRHEVITQRRALPRYCAYAPLHCSIALVFSDWTDPRSCIVCLNAFTASASATMEYTPSVFKIIACPSRSLHCTTLLTVHSSPFVFDVNSKCTPRVCQFQIPETSDSTTDAVRTPSAVRHVSRLMLPQFIASLGCPGWPLPGVVCSVCVLPLRLCLRCRLFDSWRGHLRRLQFPFLQHISCFVSYLRYCCCCFVLLRTHQPHDFSSNVSNTWHLT